MGMSEFDPAASDRLAWNARWKIGAKRALKPRQVWAIRFFLDQHRRLRDRALSELAIDSKLRGCNVISVQIGDPRPCDYRAAEDRSAGSVRVADRRTS